MFIGKNFLHADGDFSGGSGAENDPYIISNTDDFTKLAEEIANYDGQYFKLTSDLDFNNGTIKPVNSITLHFNGNGHIIKNGNITETFPGEYNGRYDDVGLFNRAAIQNLGLQNIHVRLDNYIGGHSGILLSWTNGNIENCFIVNCSIEINNITLDNKEAFIGCICGIVGGNEMKVSNCYAKNCHIDLKNTNDTDSRIVLGKFAAQINNGKSTIENCFADTSGATNFVHKYGSNVISNIYMDSEILTGENAVKDMNLGEEFRATESWPILKVFDTKINSILTNNSDTYEFNSGEVTEDLNVNLSLSNTLNLQNQNDKAAFYLDEELITEPSASTEIFIPKEKLNSLSIGEHTVKAKILDAFSTVINESSENLTLISKQPPYPEIKTLKIEPASHSASKANELSSVTATLTGNNFTAAYKINLTFKNKSTSEETVLDCGNFDGYSQTSQIINITGDNLSKIKDLKQGKYTVEVSVTK